MEMSRGERLRFACDERATPPWGIRARKRPRAPAPLLRVDTLSLAERIVCSDPSRLVYRLRKKDLATGALVSFIACWNDFVWRSVGLRGRPPVAHGIYWEKNDRF